ncbi:glycosyltransferase family 10 domain-containing protein [Desertivirga brevis]|uniref:glycosyltransferase family 10 domain-containing protein n=1 Tax=Desertivirga brevis TaxID=2810310 RepID=UPI001A9756BB|nr:glycosyltransferase family 10 [Pedobacter sp. SYSU D00873]
MKKTIKIKFQNGINKTIALNEILNDVTEDFDFVETDTPDFVLFGPYGDNLPPKGNYIRIGYFCENIIPDFNACEWAFGIPREEEIKKNNYKRIQWHGLDPKILIKHLTDNDIDRIFDTKSKFCNFLYSHEVRYRQDFFKQLSKYKRVDAPGKSMNNMPSIDTLFKGDIWERKRSFLLPYKFTIAFENYCYPGYQTEKLYDSMQVNSMPIYCGDPYISEIFNTRSFLNAPDYIKINSNPLIDFIERNSQMDFQDYRPSFYQGIGSKIKRKAKAFGRGAKMRLKYNKLDFSNLIDAIIELDKNPDLYKKKLLEPWFVFNQAPSELSTKKRWLEIFNSPTH